MRLYNGCPDDELAALWKQNDDARKRLAETAKELFGEEARARVTYFPMEDRYMACAWIGGKYHELTEFSPNLTHCAEEAVKCLKNMKG